ncbi:hypothetical protein [Chryseobacterium herbae]|uniref:hypothetical protein n=1 Tax=Chryseobacterium herbae TaxID=2976476 RepID=UPI00223B4BF7|nr:hypothetical protein [Chryseobacterium sp. pc1-10]
MVLLQDSYVLQTAIRIYNALLTYYMHIPEPGVLSDEDWAEKLQDLHFIRQKEKEASESS